MGKVIFLQTIHCKELESSGFKYLKGQEYILEAESKSCYYVRQPNSPKGKNWVTAFKKSDEGKVFQVL